MRNPYNFKPLNLRFVVNTKIVFSVFTTFLLLLNTSSTYSQSGLITNITATTGNSYTLGTLTTGVTFYTDRTYEVTSVPAFLNGAPFIKTANDDKAHKGTSVFSFDLSQSATVYVAYDSRATALPAWLSSWQKLSSQVGINDPKVSNLELYSKSFPAGEVTMSGNLASPAAGALTNYFVAALTQSPGSDYTLQVTTNGNGTVNKNPNQSDYASGTSVTLTATTAAGHQFTDWSGDATSSENPLIITMNGDKTITANFAAIGTSSKASLFVENLDKIPANDHFVFSIIQIPWRRKSDEPFNTNNDEVKVRIHNKGIDALKISKLTLSNTSTWKIDKLNTTTYNQGSRLPVSIPTEKFLDVTLKFIAKDQATRVKVLHETLKITSNDSKSQVKTVFLHGIWQRAGEGNREPYAQEILEAFAFKTKTGFVRNDPDEGDSTKLKGDEIKPSFFLRANPSLPVTATQMSAYHGCCYSTEKLYWYPKGTTTLNALYTQTKSDGQRVLPKQLNGSQTRGTFNTSKSFAFKIGFTDRTDASKNPGKKIGIRVWKAINADGEIIPNAYIISNDYLGSPATNYDYNDNAHFITNIKPDKGSVFFSELTAKPSDVDFGEKVLQTTSSFEVDLKSLGKTFSSGPDDPVITITSVQITGENSSEFSANQPSDFTLNPQQTASITVKFKPVTQGLKIADLLIHYNNSPTPLRVPLYGIGKGANTNVKVNFRIKGGRSSSITIDGKTWSGDKAYAFDNLEPFTKSGLDIDATDDDALYTTEQSSNGDKKPFRYQIPVSNGNYVLRLHFAEIYWGVPGAGSGGGAGTRVFSVKVEGQYRLINLDLAQEVGSAAALIKNIPVTVNDGKINIDFVASVNRPMVSAVEVYSFSSGSSRPDEIPTTQSDPALPLTDQAIVSGHDFSKTRVYPNPLRSPNFTIQFPSKYQGIFNIQLVDILGREYSLGKTRLNGTGSIMKVDVSRFSLKPGVYFLRINSYSDKTEVLKLLIK